MERLAELAFVSAMGPPAGVWESPSTAADHVSLVMESIERQLQAQGLKLDNVCRLLVQYLPRAGLDRRLLPDLLANRLSCAAPIALTIQPVCALPPENSAVCVLAVAVHDGGGNTLPKESFQLPDARQREPFASGVACGGFVFVAGQLATDRLSDKVLERDLVAQNAAVLKRIATVLDAFELSARDIVKFNTWRAPPPDQRAYQVAASARFAFLQEVACAVTGITIPDLDSPDALIQIDAWAVADYSRVALDPPGHWDWPAPNPYVQRVALENWVFVGGQASLDQQGRVVSPDDLAAQQTRTADHVRCVLAAAGEAFELAFANAYYCPAGAAAEVTPLAPVTTCAGVEHLAYPGQVIEIEGIARRRR